MPKVGRYVKISAKSGAGDALAGALLRVAESLAAAPGCELYIINRSSTDADAIWVTELWRSQEDLDAALQREQSKALMPEVMALVGGGVERIDLEPLGGVGHAAADRRAVEF